MKILFIGKEYDSNCKIAAEYLLSRCPKAEIVFGSRNYKIPEYLNNWKGDFVFSYLSPWIIPNEILSNAKLGSINWHPGPPEYPGIGCTNFAIYNNEQIFGITCHHMHAKVDTGPLIEVLRFSLEDKETVFSLTQKCYDLILKSFTKLVDIILNDLPLPMSNEQWTRKPYTRKELNELSKISCQMTAEEVEKRIKATTYDRPWAFMEIHGHKFYLQ